MKSNIIFGGNTNLKAEDFEGDCFGIIKLEEDSDNHKGACSDYDFNSGRCKSKNSDCDCCYAESIEL